MSFSLIKLNQLHVRLIHDPLIIQSKNFFILIVAKLKVKKLKRKTILEFKNGKKEVQEDDWKASVKAKQFTCLKLGEVRPFSRFFQVVLRIVLQ